VVFTVLLSMLVFQIKHFICDFALQTIDLVRKKSVYLHPLGLLHAGEHAVGSIPALVVLTHAPLPIWVLAASEFVVHYHVDWLKAKLDIRLGLSNENTLYWIVFGFDQFIHQLTYLAMICAALYFF
jgi:hypothetical protein